MKTNSAKSGKLLVPIVTVLYVVLSAAGLIFFFLWHWLTLPFALYLYAQLYHTSLPLIEMDEINRSEMYRKINTKETIAAEEDSNAEFGVLRTKFNNLMEAVNKLTGVFSSMKSLAAMLTILFPVMLLSLAFTLFCVDVNLNNSSAEADSVFGLEFCNCVYDSILGNR